MRSIVKFLENHQRLMSAILFIVNRISLSNRFSISKGNRFKCCGVLRKCKIQIQGKNNIIVINAFSRIYKSNIVVHGDNNNILIQEKTYLNNGRLLLDDDGGSIEIGRNTIISGDTHLAAIEGTSIKIGEDCLFSADITIRTGDSHSIIDGDSYVRINPSKSVIIGNHVWVGNGATILKGVTIQDDSIVGTGAVVTKSPDESHCILAGNPAKIIKRNINWLAERIKVEDD